MKVLVVGSGGREHAICRAVAKSPRVDKTMEAMKSAGDTPYVVGKIIDGEKGVDLV